MRRMRRLELDGVKIEVFDSVPELIARAAGRLFDLLRTDPEAVIGLATGNTFIPFYKFVADNYRKAGVSFSETVTFNLDEYLGIRSESGGSYHTYMDRNLFSKVDIRRENVHMPDSNPQDPEAEAEKYERLISRSGGIDIQFLGLGRNGHIGFNEPGTSFDSVSHVTALSEATISANAPVFGEGGDMPRSAITMGIKTILNSRRLLLLAYGDEKSSAIHETFSAGRIAESVPSTALKLHRNATMLLDTRAAKAVI